METSQLDTVVRSFDDSLDVDLVSTIISSLNVSQFCLVSVLFVLIPHFIVIFILFNDAVPF